MFQLVLKLLAELGSSHAFARPQRCLQSPLNHLDFSALSALKMCLLGSVAQILQRKTIHALPHALHENNLSFAFNGVQVMYLDVYA